jgi:hypothetical protein
MRKIWKKGGWFFLPRAQEDDSFSTWPFITNSYYHNEKHFWVKGVEERISVGLC